jgi:hypothetical protein
MTEITMRRIPGWILIPVSILIPVCHAQGLLDEVNFKSAQIGGIRLYGVSVFGGYSTSAIPQGGIGQLGNTGLGLLGPDVNYGATASLGWQRHRERTNLSILYSGTYTGMVRYSDANGFSHSLSLGASRMLTGKWTLSLSASGQDSTQAQYLFQPSNLSILSQLPASIDDLAAALSLGQFSSAQAASMLTGAPALESPATNLLLGNRVLSYSGQASLNYAYSSRLSFHLSSFTAAGQNRSGGQDGIAQQNYVMPRTIGVNAGMGLSYALSPRTQLGFSIEESRQINHYQSAYTTTALASLGRKMGRRWFLNMHAGGALIQTTQQLNGSPQSHQVVGGGSVGWQTYAHTFVSSYDRSASNSYGFAAGTNVSFTGAWNWHPRGSSWSVFASVVEQQMRNNGFSNVSGWQCGAGISERLTSHATLSVQYAYVNSTGDYLGNTANYSVQSVRVSLGWTPQTVLR